MPIWTAGPVSSGALRGPRGRFFGLESTFGVRSNSARSRSRSKEAIQTLHQAILCGRVVSGDVFHVGTHQNEPPRPELAFGCPDAFFRRFRADLPGPHRRRRSPVSPHVAGTIDRFPPPRPYWKTEQFRLAALPIISSESEPSRRDKWAGSDPPLGDEAHAPQPCCMDHPEGCLIIVFFNTGDNLAACRPFDVSRLLSTIALFSSKL